MQLAHCLKHWVLFFMFNKLVLTICILLIIFIFVNIIISTNCKSNDLNQKKNSNEISKDLKLNVIGNFSDLDEDSVNEELMNVGKYYADIKLGEKNNICTSTLYYKIYDEKVSINNGRYFFEFSYDLFNSPFGDMKEGVDPKNFFFLKKYEKLTMYFEFEIKEGFWEIKAIGKKLTL